MTIIGEWIVLGEYGCPSSESQKGAHTFSTRSKTANNNSEPFLEKEALEASFVHAGAHYEHQE